MSSIMRRYWGAVIPPRDYHREFRVVKGLLDVKERGYRVINRKTTF